MVILCPGIILCPDKPIGQENGDYMGSYYVLEVANFDPALDQKVEQEEEEPHQEVPPLVVPVLDSDADNYYMLNTDDPTLSTERDGQEAAAYSSVRSSRGCYENTSIQQPPPTAVTTAPQSTSNVSPRLHPHLVIADDNELEENCQAGVKSEGKSSAYVNISPSDVTTSDSVRCSSVSGAYENIKPKQSSLSHQSLSASSLRSTAAVPSSSGSEVRMRRLAQQRQENYEVVPLGGLKINGVGKNRPSSTSVSPDNGTGTLARH